MARSGSFARADPTSTLIMSMWKPVSPLVFIGFLILITACGCRCGCKKGSRGTCLVVDHSTRWSGCMRSRSRKISHRSTSGSPTLTTCICTSGLWSMRNRCPGSRKMQYVAGGLEVGDLRGPRPRSRPPPAGCRRWAWPRGRARRSIQRVQSQVPVCLAQTRLQASAGELGTSCCSDRPWRRMIPVPPPKVDHLGCLAVCWETEL
jgi:hypothetical protein